MRTLFIATLFILSGIAAADAREVVLSVPGMNCPVCPITISKSLKKIEGVEVTATDLDQKLITVHAPDTVPNLRLMEATSNAGYPSTIHPGGSNK
ncbi:MAG: cation transporter [Oceanococcus sp.]